MKKYQSRKKANQKKFILDAIGIPSPHIYAILKRYNPRYKRRSDKKVFFIREERDEKLCSIDGEDFFYFQQIKDRFGISPTVFLNQIERKRKHFIEANEISHFVSDLCFEMEKLCDLKKKRDMFEKSDKAKTRGPKANPIKI